MLARLKFDLHVPRGAVVQFQRSPALGESRLDPAASRVRDRGVASAHALSSQKRRFKAISEFTKSFPFTWWPVDLHVRLPFAGARGTALRVVAA